MEHQQQFSKTDVQNIANQCKKTKKIVHSNLKTPERSIVKDFLKTMSDNNDQISDDAEKFITDYISNIILNTTKTACKIAVSRKSPNLEKKDMEFAIQIQLAHKKKMNASHSSSGMDNIFLKPKEPKQEHLDNMALLEKFQQSKREENK